MKVFLILVALSGGQWVQINDDPIEQDSLAACTQAAGNFLSAAQAQLDGDIPAVGATCVIGKVPSDGK